HTFTGTSSPVSPPTRSRSLFATIPPTSKFSYSISPRPTPLTLFPYTTLFRSARRLHPPEFRLAKLGASRAPPELSRRYLSDNSRSEEQRLNSSHVASSYALCCLKKNTTTTNPTS